MARGDGGSADEATASRLLAAAPDGIAVVDLAGLLRSANPAAARLLGLDPDALVGVRSPFVSAGAGHLRGADLSAAAGPERTTTWARPDGERCEFAFRQRMLGDDAVLVAFRDVTETRRHQRRLAAIASAASQVATRRSLRGTLVALAKEVLEADALAGVQVLTVNPTGERFQVMGTAGFVETPDFFDRLVRCRERGAELRMMQAFATRRPVIVPHRYAAVMADPAWEPLRDNLSTPEWDWFASVPLMVRGEPVGVMNGYYAPGQEIGGPALDFLLAMAEQAAQAVHVAALIDRERDVAQREERQRLARDLHDSVVQHAFSMGMQVESLGLLATRGPAVDSVQVTRVTDELRQLSRTVLSDLRGMVRDLHPTSIVDQGLAAAVAALAESTRARTGLDVQVSVTDPGHDVDDLEAQLGEDVYRIVAEAVQNSVKHAHASRIEISLTRLGDSIRSWLQVDVRDDGVGLAEPREAGTPTDQGGFGMTSMAERALRWSGDLTVESKPGQGTAVRAVLPVPAPLPTGLVGRIVP